MTALSAAPAVQSPAASNRAVGRQRLRSGSCWRHPLRRPALSLESTPWPAEQPRAHDRTRQRHLRAFPDLVKESPKWIRGQPTLLQIALVDRIDRVFTLIDR